MRTDWRDAAVYGDAAQIERLLAENIAIDSRDRYGQTALMLAAMYGRSAVVRLLIDHDADLDATAKYSLSALMLAIVNRHVDIAMILIDAGADTQLRGSGAPGFSGKTALDLALTHGLTALAARLAEAGD